MQNFKPQLLPNNPVGEAMDWETLLGDSIQDYMCSIKEDGIRSELQYDTPAKGRSLKDARSIHVQRMHKELQDATGMFGGILEAEFYSPTMTFSEIMHFYASTDVESEKSFKKHSLEWDKTEGGTTTYAKKQGNTIIQQGWEFPGRTPEWLCTWNDSLKFYVFDYYLQDGISKLDRYLMSKELIEDAEYEHLKLIRQFQCPSLEHMYEAYDQAAMQKSEGLVLIHKDAPYKFGRHTLKSKMAFKVKDDNLEFDGKILSVVEGTIAREGAEKTVNELGRSKTSQLKEDRVPSGMAKGFEVLMEDGNILIVSLTGYNHDERRQLLYNHADYSNRWIKFTGMAPVKEGGCPRHAHFTKGDFRDEK